MSSLSERKAIFDAFNKECKRVMREFRELLPGMGRALAVVMLVLKVSKRVNRRLPHRYFVEVIHAPFGARVTARDERFFLSDAFQVRNYESVVADIKSQWLLLDAAGRETVWRRVSDLLALSERCMAAGRGLSAPAESGGAGGGGELDD
jgi:hypothetical protein